MEVILVPASRRSKFLTLSLASLYACRGIDKYKVICHLDAGCTEAMKRVLASFKNKLNLEVRIRTDLHSSTANILEGLKYSQDQTDNYVIVVEEDVRVTRDFLEYQEYVWRHLWEPKTFSSCGCAVEDREDFTQEEIEAVRVRPYPYWGVATLIPKVIFDRLIREHCTFTYYRNLYGYADSYHPTWHLRGSYVEQDGLLSRVVDKNKMEVLFPVLTRGQHMGYTRGEPRESFEEIERILNNKEEYLRRRILAKDFSRFRGDYKWSKLRRLFPERK